MFGPEVVLWSQILVLKKCATAHNYYKAVVVVVSADFGWKKWRKTKEVLGLMYIPVETKTVIRMGTKPRQVQSTIRKIQRNMCRLDRTKRILLEWKWMKLRSKDPLFTSKKHLLLLKLEQSLFSLKLVYWSPGILYQ